MAVPIMLAVNDDNGNHTKKINEIEIGDVVNGDFIRLDALEAYMLGDGITCYLVDAFKLRIGRRVFPINGYTKYVGNIVWYCAHVDEKVAAEIVNYLHRRGDFTFDEATESFSRKWHDDEEFIETDFVKK